MSVIRVVPGLIPPYEDSIMNLHLLRKESVDRYKGAGV